MKLMAAWKSVTVVMLVGLLAACSGKNVVESDLGIKGAPDWVNEGTNILKDKNGRLFHGVGIAPPMGDLSLQKTMADNRARAELARVLSSYMDVVSNDYIAASGTGDSVNAEQNVSRQINAMTKVNLTGAKIIGRWRDKRTNTIYSLAEMDLQAVKATARQVKEMNSDLSRYIDDNADNIFDRVAGGNN